MLSEFSVGRGGGEGRGIANLVMVISLRTANIILAACRFNYFDQDNHVFTFV